MFSTFPYNNIHQKWHRINNKFSLFFRWQIIDSIIKKVVVCCRVYTSIQFLLFLISLGWIGTLNFENEFQLLTTQKMIDLHTGEMFNNFHGVAGIKFTLNCLLRFNYRTMFFTHFPFAFFTNFRTLFHRLFQVNRHECGELYGE